MNSQVNYVCQGLNLICLSWKKYFSVATVADIFVDKKFLSKLLFVGPGCATVDIEHLTFWPMVNGFLEVFAFGRQMILATVDFFCGKNGDKDPPKCQTVQVTHRVNINFIVKLWQVIISSPWPCAMLLQLIGGEQITILSSNPWSIQFGCHRLVNWTLWALTNVISCQVQMTRESMIEMINLFQSKSHTNCYPWISRGKEKWIKTDQWTRWRCLWFISLIHSPLLHASEIKSVLCNFNHRH